MEGLKRFERFIRHGLRSKQTKQLRALQADLESLQGASQRQLLLSAGPECQRVRQLPHATPLAHTEFRVFSQWGEDGILQFLTSHLPITEDVFIEFGVEDYLESNTRFLLLKNGWRGLVLDGSEANIEKIRQNRDFWRHDLQARCAFITPANINDLIREAGLHGDIGLLSIDIDGNDYHVLKAIRSVRPRVLVIEYNGKFPPPMDLVPPYDADRNWDGSDYAGASLQAIANLAARRGYRLVGTNLTGVNAFFVREDLCGVHFLEPATAEEHYEPPRYFLTAISAGHRPALGPYVAV